MKKINYLEIIGVLSLSLLLTSALAVSSCLPEMMKVFSDYSRSSLELLMSIQAFAMVLVVASSPFLLRVFNERTMVIVGLVLYGVSGVAPAFIESYELILISRILLGVGTGMINTRAISMIGERFSGALQQRLQGIRCSMETLGQAILTFMAGQLLRINWHYSFLVYGVAFVILFIYIRFVPHTKNVKKKQEEKKEPYKLTRAEWFVIVQNCVLGCVLVSASVTSSLRLTSYITENGIGTAVNGATIISLATLVGFLGGLVFGTLMKTLMKFMFPFSSFMAGVGFLIIISSNSLAIISVGASIVSFFVTNSISYLFNRLSSRLPKQALDTGNAFALVGCNMGSFITPFVLQFIGMFNSNLSVGFLVYGVGLIVISFTVLVRNLLLFKNR